MFTTTLRRLIVLGTLAVLFAVPRAAEAGPPLICHPFDVGSAALLSWGAGSGWNSPDRSYDVQRLTADTLRLLSPEATILARMENLRRATIYASQNRKVADDLLAAVLARASSATGSASVQARFDAGYLIESYRQASHIYNWNMLSSAEKRAWALRDEPRGLDGYALVLEALRAGSNPEIEFAASLMKEGTVSSDHRRRAAAGAVPGSPLARNLQR